MSVKKAAEDMKYLLDKNYPKRTALNLVVNHYKLNPEEKNFLIRYVFSDVDIENHKSRLMQIVDIKDREIVVDAYNVLITTEAILSGGGIVECMDGFLRDTASIFSRYRFSKNSEKAIEKVLQVISVHKPKSVLFILDSQISRSGDLASFIRKRMKEFGIDGTAKTSLRADYEIARLNRITMTSDSIIIERVDRVVGISRVIRDSF